MSDESGSRRPARAYTLTCWHKPSTGLPELLFLVAEPGGVVPGAGVAWRMDATEVCLGGANLDTLPGVVPGLSPGGVRPGDGRWPATELHPGEGPVVKGAPSNTAGAGDGNWHATPGDGTAGVGNCRAMLRGLAAPDAGEGIGVATGVLSAALGSSAEASASTCTSSTG